MAKVHSHTDLLEILREWHRASPSERPAPFPGPLAGKNKLTSWLDDISARAVMHNICRQQWANAILAWIPATPEGGNGFKQRLLKLLRENDSCQSGDVKFWEWDFFKHWFFHLCGRQFVKVTGYDLFLRDHKGEKFYAIISAAAASAIALPAIGLPLLGAVGFTSAGVAGGSIAAGVQSTIYGGATGGIFSLLQSIGARAAFPMAWHAAAAALGGATAAIRDGDSSQNHDIDDFTADIGL